MTVQPAKAGAVITWKWSRPPPSQKTRGSARSATVVLICGTGRNVRSAKTGVLTTAEILTLIRAKNASRAALDAASRGWLQEVRAERGWLQSNLSAALGISLSAVAMAETGEHRLSDGSITRLATLLSEIDCPQCGQYTLVDVCPQCGYSRSPATIAAGRR